MDLERHFKSRPKSKSRVATRLAPPASNPETKNAGMVREIWREEARPVCTIMRGADAGLFPRHVSHFHRHVSLLDACGIEPQLQPQDVITRGFDTARRCRWAHGKGDCARAGAIRPGPGRRVRLARGDA